MVSLPDMTGQWLDIRNRIFTYTKPWKVIGIKEPRVIEGDRERAFWSRTVPELSVQLSNFRCRRRFYLAGEGGGSSYGHVHEFSWTFAIHLAYLKRLQLCFLLGISSCGSGFFPDLVADFKACSVSSPTNVETKSPRISSTVCSPLPISRQALRSIQCYGTWWWWLLWAPRPLVLFELNMGSVLCC